MAVALNDDDTVIRTYSSLSLVSCTSLLSKSQRLLLGLLLLLCVNVIWVLSSELTKVSRKLLLFLYITTGLISHSYMQYIFINTEFDKPFFTTYFKTSMFMVYLMGFMFSKSWRSTGQNIEYQQLKQDVLDEPEDLTSVIVIFILISLKIWMN